MKKPERMYEPKHNDDLKNYAKGWNSVIEELNENDDEEYLKMLKDETADFYRRSGLVWFEGAMDCIKEIEALNEDPFAYIFKDSLKMLDELGKE